MAVIWSSGSGSAGANSKFAPYQTPRGSLRCNENWGNFNPAEEEMLREANTIASKSVDAEVTHLVVGIKSEIDKLKEQLQNVE